MISCWLGQTGGPPGWGRSARSLPEGLERETKPTAEGSSARAARTSASESTSTEGWMPFGPQKKSSKRTRVPAWGSRASGRGNPASGVVPEMLLCYDAPSLGRGGAKVVRATRFSRRRA